MGKPRFVEPSAAHCAAAPDLSGEFCATHWSVVLEAGRENSPEAAQALERLCGAYWYLLYANVRRQGQGPDDAQDLVQEFFARLLERNYRQLAAALSD